MLQKLFSSRWVFSNGPSGLSTIRSLGPSMDPGVVVWKVFLNGLAYPGAFACGRRSRTSGRILSTRDLRQEYLSCPQLWENMVDKKPSHSLDSEIKEGIIGFEPPGTKSKQSATGDARGRAVDHAAAGQGYKKFPSQNLALPGSHGHLKGYASIFGASFDVYGNLRILCNGGRVNEALEFLDLIDEGGICTCSDMYVCILQECIEMKALTEGKQVHIHLMKNGLKINIFLGNMLVNMYLKCGSLLDAHEIFDKMLERDVCSWTLMISGYLNHGHHSNALKLFQEMQGGRIKPDDVAFVCALKACANLTALENGKQIHANIVLTGYESDVFVESTLIDMYGKCSSLDDAHKVFNSMSQRNVVSWNALIAECAQHGHTQEVFKLFQQMKWESVNPDEFTFVSLLRACATAIALEEGKQIHTLVVTCGKEASVFVGSSLVDMYAKCGRIEEAYTIFEDMPRRNVVSWSAMIAGYVEQGDCDRALELFNRMEREGVMPNRVTFGSILLACSSLKYLEQGKWIHYYIIGNGSGADIYIENSLVDMYAKCGSIEDAFQVFTNMSVRNVVSWNSMIGGYTEHRNQKEALKCFEQMKLENVQPDEVTYVSILKACAMTGLLEQGKHIHAVIRKTALESSVLVGSSLVAMYTKAGSLEYACEVFDKVRQCNVVLWNSMISGYAVYSDHSEHAIKLFVQMQNEDLKPNEVTYVSVLKACGNLAAFENGKQIHCHIIKGIFNFGLIVGNALVDMYAKCGSIEDAHRVFDKMLERDAVSWNSIIAGYAQHGNAEEVFHLSRQMELEGFNFDPVTFAGLLSVCSRAGLVGKGQHFFHSMTQDHGITPTAKHHACMVDLFGRVGCLDEAIYFLMKFPSHQNAMVWIPLLGACRLWGDPDLAKSVAESILQLEPQITSALILLSNIYAAAGRWEDRAKVRKMLDGGTGK